MDRLRVLHVIWSANLGGITRLVLNLCDYQRRNDLAQADILVCRQHGIEKTDSQKSAIRIHELDLRSGTDFNPVKIMRCVKIMRDYDFIHLHIFHPLIAFSALQSGKGILFTEHGNFGLGRAIGIRGRVVQFLKTKFLVRSDVAITCNSRFTALTLSEINRIPQDKLQVVYNGIPDTHTLPQTASSWKRPDEFLVVSIGRLAKVKRFDRVIEAFRMADIDKSRLIIMGDGPELAQLERTVNSLPPGPPVELIGPGNGTSLLQEADLCIIGTQGEAFGLVAIEAYQAGKQVLVFEDGGGVTEIAGALDPNSVCKDIPGMANRIRAIHASGIYSDTERAANSKRYAAGFSLKKMAEAFNRLYLS